MKLAIKRPGEPLEFFETESIDETLDDLFQIATTCLSSRNWVALCEDNGYAMKLKANFPRVTDGHMIVGPVLFVGKSHADFVGLSQSAKEEIMNPFTWTARVVM